MQSAKSDQTHSAQRKSGSIVSEPSSSLRHLTPPHQAKDPDEVINGSWCFRPDCWGPDPSPGDPPTLPVAQDPISAPGAISLCPSNAVGRWSPAPTALPLFHHHPCPHGGAQCLGLL